MKFQTGIFIAFENMLAHVYTKSSFLRCMLHAVASGIGNYTAAHTSMDFIIHG